ncbi:MAG: 1-acyl-sn-glycerol-3-phosphate acyltransferase [Bacteroidales bacterium]|nr:1-acyl-sn-glycerol-3-phosphate acyltransferase [Bacteroidales bacterium]
MARKSFIYRCLEGIFFPATRIIHNPLIYKENGEIIKKIHFDEPTILISNHIAHRDGTVLSYLTSPDKLHSLAAKDRFEQGGLMKWYLTQAECIPIDRKGISTDWVHDSVKMLREQKESVAIFPEGRHGLNHEILPFHSAATTVAVFSGAPIVILYNDGPYKLGKRCRFMVSEPFRLPAPTAGLDAAYIAEQTDFTRERMLSLQKKLQAIPVK